MLLLLVQFSSQSFNPSKLLLALSQCHIDIKKFTDRGPSARIRAPQIRQLRVQMLSHQRTSGRNLGGRPGCSRGQADVDFHVQKPLDLWVHLGHRCVFIGGPKRKVSILYPSEQPEEWHQQRWQMDFTAFHSDEMPPCLKSTLVVAGNLPPDRDAPSCQEVVQSPWAAQMSPRFSWIGEMKQAARKRVNIREFSCKW